MILSPDALCKKLNYQFRDEALLTEALTHRSAAKRNNERLEFLGDSILNFVIADELFSRFPESQEGELSRLRASLVKGDKLAEIASRFSLGDYLILGPGELKSGGFRRASILADAMEALFGAIYQDQGFAAARKVIYEVYETSLENIDVARNFKDPKTRLQEYLQSRQLPLPEYNVIDVKGEAHNQVFTVSCKVTGIAEEIIGSGSSRRKAEQAAAKSSLEKLANE